MYNGNKEINMSYIKFEKENVLIEDINNIRLNDWNPKKKKGKGYKPAEENSSAWHGVGSFNHETGELKKSSLPSISEVVSNTVHEFMEEDNDIVTITPAMINGSKLEKIFKDFPLSVKVSIFGFNV